MFSKNFAFNNETILHQVKKGHEFQKHGEIDKAEAIYLTILSQNPNELNSLFSLATLYQQIGKTPVAISLFKRLLMLAPPNASIYNNMGGCMHQDQDMKGAYEAYSAAYRITKGKDADVLSNLGGLYVNEGTPKIGLEYLNKAIEIKSDHLHANWNRSLVLLELQRWEEGFEGYEYGIETGDRKNKTYEGIPRWDGSDCGTIIVCGEQGIGDEIMFSSILLDLSRHVNRIIFDCHPRLADIFKHHKAGKNCELVVVPTRKKKEVSWLNEYSPDFHVNAGSLGKYYRKNNEDFHKETYINIPDDILDKWRMVLNKISDKPKIGLSWFGGAKKTRADIRSIPLEHLMPVLNSEDYIFINLQYNIKENNLDEFERKSGIKIHYVTTEDDYFSWACLANCCDIILSVCTSLTHLAGACGIPSICMVPSKPAWRYGLTDNKMIWYDSVRLVRQKEQDEWREVVDEVKELLCDNILRKSV